LTLAALCAAVALPIDPSTADERHRFSFTDGERALVIVRGGARGHDDARVPGWLVDTASGRRAPVLVGHTAIVRAWDGMEASADVHVMRELMPSLGMVLVESTRGAPYGGLPEDGAELAARLPGAYPNLAFRMRALEPVVAAFDPPNDPRYPSQFYLDEIDIEAAWARSVGARDVEVLVVDNGCDLVHPDLIDKLLPGVDPIDDDDDPSFEAGPGNEHGTACAGLIAASTNNGTDIAGACPECSLRCARLLPGEGEFSTVASDVLSFAFALEEDVDIVSNSWGFIDAVPVPGPLKDAIVEVNTNGRGGKGAVVVFASGNDARIIGDDELLAVEGVIGVGAVNNLGELTQFSNGGAAVDLVAPTGSIATDISGPGGADAGDVTVSFGGTSSACPIVAGVVGLMLANDPALTAAEVTEALIGTARQSIFATPTDDGHDDFYGFGLVQPAPALAFFDPAPPPGDVDEPPGGCTCGAATDQLPWVLAVGIALVRGRRGARAACPLRAPLLV
jgi:subtilisin family serine protease